MYYLVTTKKKIYIFLNSGHAVLVKKKYKIYCIFTEHFKPIFSYLRLNYFNITLLTVTQSEHKVNTKDCRKPEESYHKRNTRHQDNIIGIRLVPDHSLFYLGEWLQSTVIKQRSICTVSMLNPGLQSLKASVSIAEHTILNSVNANTQPCFTPFDTGKASDNSPLSSTFAFIPSRNWLYINYII